MLKASHLGNPTEFDSPRWTAWRILKMRQFVALKKTSVRHSQIQSSHVDKPIVWTPTSEIKWDQVRSSENTIGQISSSQVESQPGRRRNGRTGNRTRGGPGLFQVPAAPTRDARTQQIAVLRPSSSRFWGFKASEPKTSNSQTTGCCAWKIRKGVT